MNTGKQKTKLSDADKLKIKKEKFWNRVNVSGENDCWEWKGKTTEAVPYGRTTFKGKNTYAHRLAYFFATGKFAEPQTLHSCDNPICCNPAHLFEGTANDNNTDRDNKRRGYHQRSDWKNPNAKLDEKSVREIKRRLANGEKGKIIAKDFNVDPSNISRIKRGIGWSNIE